MFRIKVIAHGKLSRTSRIGMDGLVMSISDGARIRDLLSEVGVLDVEVRRVMVNGRRGRLEQALRRNDLIELHG
ncbi:MAG: hypothetical protein IMF16_06845 [Proteobacteria bacterium]|nr:hypothetical protein [Pseudomonadota bacterium]